MTDEEKTLFNDWKNKNKDKIESVVITLLNYEKGVDTKTCYDEIDWLIQKAYFAGYNKANEWHEIESKVSPKREISKKYMPKNKEKVLLKYHFSGDNEVHISDGYYDAYDFQFHIANNPKHRIVCVIAWKEVVLPELKESE